MAQVPTKARAVIIGGGVIGCSLAYHLAKFQLFTGIDGFSILLEGVHNEPKYAVPGIRASKNFDVSTCSSFEEFPFIGILAEQSTNQILCIKFVTVGAPFHHVNQTLNGERLSRSTRCSTSTSAIAFMRSRSVSISPFMVFIL